MKQIKRIVTKQSLPGLITMLAKRFEPEEVEPIVMILRPLDKTHEQLGYFHSAVLPILTEILFDAGEIKHKSESEAKYYLKVLMGYGEWISFRNSLVFDPKSFEKATTEDLSVAIDRAIAECEKRGAYVPEPKESRLLAEHKESINKTRGC